MISWVGYDSDANSWQPKKNLRCPALLAEFESSLKDNRKKTRTRGKHKNNNISFANEQNEVLAIPHLLLQFLESDSSDSHQVRVQEDQQRAIKCKSQFQVWWY